jgi:hypothetical protein
MADDQKVTSDQEKPNAPWLVELGMFGLKTVIFLIILGFGINQFIEFTLAPIDVKLKGGAYFWKPIEEGLYKVADMPDLPPEKREKIIEALEKIGHRYRPYIQALTGEEPRQTAQH